MTQSDIIAIDGKCLRRSLDKASNKAAICVVSNPRQIHPLSNMGSAGLKIHDNLFFIFQASHFDRFYPKSISQTQKNRP